MKTLFCIGELLIDWISTDINQNLTDAVHFIKKAGGAPANVTIAAVRLGGKAEFAGKVGNDAFGNFLKKTLECNHVKTDNLLQCEIPTTFAFVSLQENGERDFIFQRGADELLRFQEIRFPNSETVYHFGSATAFLSNPLQETYYQSLDFALQKKCFVSFDPNFRDALWENQEQNFIMHCKKFIPKADFIKVSDEELQLITECEDLDEAVRTLEIKKEAIVCVTLGKKGTLLYYDKKIEIIESISVKSIDSTGAGDAFVGAMLKQICDQLPKDYETIKKYVGFANKVAAVSTTEFGAIEALPTAEKMATISPMQ